MIDAESLKRLMDEHKQMIEALHKIQDAATVTTAHVEAFTVLLKIGEVADERC